MAGTKRLACGGNDYHSKCVISGETVIQRRRPLLATDSGQPVLTADMVEGEAETVQESA